MIETSVTCDICGKDCGHPNDGGFTTVEGLWPEVPGLFRPEMQFCTRRADGSEGCGGRLREAIKRLQWEARQPNEGSAIT